jgi:hypothetical protein
LRCEAREKLIAYLQQEYPGALPRMRQEVVGLRTMHHTELSPHALVPQDQAI